MSNLIKQYETKLQTAYRTEIAAILDAKLEATSPFAVADYVEFSIGNLKAQQARIKQAIDELREISTSVGDQIELIGEGVSEWLTEAGIDKLEGDHVSSITVSQRKPKEELVIDDEEALITQGYFKPSVDKTAVKNAIKDGVEVDGAHIDITHLADTIRVNKKRGKATE